MAIAFDAVSTGNKLSWSHTVGTGDNRMLIVGVTTYDFGSTYHPVTSVTFNGVSMTKARSDSSHGSFDWIETSVWLLHNPASGTHTISYTTSAGWSAGMAVSYTGVHQSSTADAVGGAIGTTSGGSQSFTVNTIEDNCWVFAVGEVYKSSSPSIAANQTSRASVTVSSGSALGRCEDTNGPISPSGSTTMGFTLSTSNSYWAMTGVSFAPAAIPQFNLSGSISTSTIVSGSEKTDRSLTSTLSAISALEGRQGLFRPIAATMQTSTALFGSMGLLKPLDKSVISSECGIEGGAVGLYKQLSSFITAHTFIAGSAVLDITLSGAIIASADNTASASAWSDLSGSIEAESNVNGDLYLYKSLRSVIEAQSNVLGTTYLDRMLSSSPIEAVADVFGASSSIKSLSSVIQAEAGVAGISHVARSLSGAIELRAETIGSPSLYRGLVGGIASESYISSKLYLNRSFSSAIKAVANIGGPTHLDQRLIGSIPSSSVVDGNESTLNDLLGSISTSCDLSGTGLLLNELVGTVGASTYLSGAEYIYIRHSGYIQAYTGLAGLLTTPSIGMFGYISVSAQLSATLRKACSLAGRIESTCYMEAELNKLIRSYHSVLQFDSKIPMSVVSDSCVSNAIERSSDVSFVVSGNSGISDVSKGSPISKAIQENSGI